jgi:hypothetical protein
MVGQGVEVAVEILLTPFAASYARQIDCPHTTGAAGMDQALLLGLGQREQVTGPSDQGSPQLAPLASDPGQEVLVVFHPTRLATQRLLSPLCGV